MNFQRLSILIFGLLGTYLLQAQNTSDLIYLDQGSLMYVPFAMNGQTNEINTIPDFFKKADAAMETQIPGCRPVSFGHFGDGNIHYNITQPVNMDKQAFLDQWQAVSETVFDIVDRFDGSISAEHGIGIMKKADLAKRADPVKLAMLKSVKQALDPDNMMNPRVMI